MPTPEDNLRQRVRSLRLILEVARRFDDFVAIFRRSADAADATTQIAQTFGCTESDAHAFLLHLSVERLTLPSALQRLEAELAELEQDVGDAS